MKQISRQKRLEIFKLFIEEKPVSLESWCRKHDVHGSFLHDSCKAYARSIGVSTRTVLDMLRIGVLDIGLVAQTWRYTTEKKKPSSLGERLAAIEALLKMYD